MEIKDENSLQIFLIKFPRQFPFLLLAYDYRLDVIKTTEVRMRTKFDKIVRGGMMRSMKRVAGR